MSTLSNYKVWIGTSPSARSPFAVFVQFVQHGNGDLCCKAVQLSGTRVDGAASIRQVAGVCKILEEKTSSARERSEPAFRGTGR